MTMEEARITVVDFIAKGHDFDEWRMVIVETGPWTQPIDQQLRRVQERLYGCVDAALSGRLAEQFPQTTGQNIVIQVDCYDLPRIEVEDFFNRFAEGIFGLADYRDELASSRFVKTIQFEISFERT